MDIVKDFKDKTKSLANWLTSIVISNLVYLIRLNADHKNDSLWNDNLIILKLDFIFTAAALLFMGVFKIIDVWASWRRLNKSSDQAFEETKTWVFALTSALCIFPAIFLSVIILWQQFFK